MIHYFQNKFALSEKGARDLMSASISCTFTNLSLMIPIAIIYLLLEELISPIYKGIYKEPNILKYILLSTLALSIIYIFQYIQYNKTFFSSYNESANKRIFLAEKLRKLPLSFFAKKYLSDLTTTIMSDCAGLETAFSHYIPELIGSVLSVVIAGIGLLLMNWKMAISLLWVVPVAFIIVVVGKRKQDKGNMKNKISQLERADKIQECIETVREIKANNMSKKYMSELNEYLRKSEQDSISAELGTSMFVISAQMLLRVGIATVILIGGKLLIKAEVDLLTFIAFLIAASRIFDPLSTSLINLAAIFGTLIQINRMKGIEEYKFQDGKEENIKNNFDICFDHVKFSYNDSEKVLRDVSFTAKQGEVTALVGPSGGGKSTVAKLAARFWDVDSGKITLGGYDISRIEPESLLKNYSIVFQDVVLFDDTIMNNIRLGKRDASDDEVIKVAKLARCHDFIEKMTDGYNTVIGENGSTLSGGERQRISIARALLKDADVILLDEATASLDVENETKIQEAITNLIKGKTVIVIAHRMRTIANADKIIVLSEGYVAEEGTSKDLIKQDGIYAKMVHLQNMSRRWSI